MFTVQCNQLQSGRGRVANAELTWEERAYTQLPQASTCKTLSA